MDLSTYKIKNKKIYTKEQELADQIHSYFDKKLGFPMIMNFIKTKGYQFVYEVWNEVKQSNPKNRLSLFMYKIGEEKIIFFEDKKINAKNAN